MNYPDLLLIISMALSVASMLACFYLHREIASIDKSVFEFISTVKANLDQIKKNIAILDRNANLLRSCIEKAGEQNDRT